MSEASDHRSLTITSKLINSVNAEASYPNINIVKNPLLVVLHSHIHNVLTNGAQHKSMVKSMYKRIWLHFLVNA